MGQQPSITGKKKILNHKDMPGFISATKKPKGFNYVDKETICGNLKKTKLPTKRTIIKAK